MNQNITKYLNNESLDELNKSIGYKMLIKNPKMIEQLKRGKMQAEASLIPTKESIAEKKKSLEDMNAGNIFQKGFKALFKGRETAEKEKAIKKELEILQAEVERIEATIAKHDDGILAIQEQIDEFVATLKAEGLVSDEVVATYYALKEQLEAQEKIAREENEKRYNEEKARKKAEAELLAPTPSQNSKTRKKLTPIEKFERRKKIAEVKAGEKQSD